jgi:uncharacterized membrane protein (UPF0127 family)
MRFALPVFLVLITSCGTKPTTVEDFNTTELTLPHGQVVKIETMIADMDRLRGLMFRTSLAPDHGMLFVNPKMGNYAFWMYQILFPLDVIWIGSDRRIVEIVENIPPCKTTAKDCPRYGGGKLAQYMLALGAGSIKKYGIEVGQTIQW